MPASFPADRRGAAALQELKSFNDQHRDRIGVAPIFSVLQAPPRKVTEGTWREGDAPSCCRRETCMMWR